MAKKSAASFSSRRINPVPVVFLLRFPGLLNESERKFKKFLLEDYWFRHFYKTSVKLKENMYPNFLYQSNVFAGKYIDVEIYGQKPSRKNGILKVFCNREIYHTAFIKKGKRNAKSSQKFLSYN